MFSKIKLLSLEIQLKDMRKKAETGQLTYKQLLDYNKLLTDKFLYLIEESKKMKK